MKALVCAECGPVTGTWFRAHLEEHHGLDFTGFDATRPRAHPASRMYSVRVTADAFVLEPAGRGKRTRL